MSDYRIPDLPSDEELGITPEDRKKFAAGEAPDLSPQERAALLGEAHRPPHPPQKTARPTARPTAPPSGPRSRWQGPTALALLLAASWLVSSHRLLPPPQPANVPDTVFSSARAMAHLVEIARRPHPPGSPAHEQVRGYLLERLRGLGLEPEVQTTTSLLERGAAVRAATVRNIVARVPGTASSGTIVLTAHYDGREVSRAAADAGVGVVAILETVRAVQAGPRLRNDLLVLITDAEELGLLGARAFVAEHPAMADVALVLSLEMRGGGGPSVMFETSPENGWIIRALRDSGARPFANSLSYEAYRRMPNDTDFTPFREAGRQGLNFAAIGRASLYHQHYDTPENVSEATLQHKGASVLEVVRHLGNETLDEVHAPDAAFFTAPVMGLVAYDPGLTLPLAAAVVVLALLVLLFVRRATPRAFGIGAGLLLALVVAAATAGAGWGLVSWLPRFHPEYGSLHGSAFHGEGWYVAALVALALAVTAGLLGIVRRWFGIAELAWGALLVPMAIMVYVALIVPSAAANVLVPLAAAYLAAGAVLLPLRGRLQVVSWALTVALAVPALALLVPVVELVWQAFSLQAAPLVGALVALSLLFLLPAVDHLRSPNGWWAPVTALAVGCACLGLGIRAARPDAARPAPSTLAYLQDHGTREALWITEGISDPVDEPARAWVADRTGASFDEARSLERYGLGRREFRVAPAAPVDARKPELWALADTVIDGTRHLRLGVRSAIRAELLQFRVPEDGTTRIAALNGRPFAPGRRPTLVEHWGAPDPLLVLDLEMPAGVALELDVVEHLLRPEELLGPEPFRRPPELAPDIRWLSDRVVLRTPAAALDVIPGEPPFLSEVDGRSPPGDPPDPDGPPESAG